MQENSQQNKMLNAYRHLLQSAKETAIAADMKTWDLLKTAVDKVATTSAELSVLTENELNQVQDDLKKDIEMTAEYLNDLQQGIEEYLEMDLPVLESYLREKALSLADPTEITILRMRLAAALAKD